MRGGVLLELYLAAVHGPQAMLLLLLPGRGQLGLHAALLLSGADPVRVDLQSCIMLCQIIVTILYTT